MLTACCGSRFLAIEKAGQGMLAERCQEQNGAGCAARACRWSCQNTAHDGILECEYVRVACSKN
eukprot:4604024-Pyramimonas_sp.AAC.1